ncbi:hypothetical protein PRIPAC_93777, partial [Pristionchus pacificus]
SGNSIMITDVQLGIAANIIGIGVFMLVVLFHYITVNNGSSSIKNH